MLETLFAKWIILGPILGPKTHMYKKLITLASFLLLGGHPYSPAVDTSNHDMADVFHAVL